MSETLETVRVGFIGAGQMALALARGFLEAGLVRAEQIVACDVVAESAERFARETGGTIVASSSFVVQSADIVILAVKPQHLMDVLKSITGVPKGAKRLYVSIAAGVTLARLGAGLGENRRIIRVMPNTPCLVHAGASAFSRNEFATPEDGKLVAELLGSVGLVVETPEKQLDAVTGLSGSGPAYAYLMIEALSDGGVRMGLPRAVATQLAAQTLLGAAKMVLETHQHPGALKDAVTSPGGTTIAGLHALEAGGLRGILMDGVQAATERAIELGQA